MNEFKIGVFFGVTGTILVLILAVLIGAPLLAQTPATTVAIPLPARDQITIEDLQTQIANCTITAANEQRYEAKLIARIRELEKQLADLKPAPKAPALPAESKAKP